MTTRALSNVHERIHLEYLDGIRALAALYVTAFHTYGRVMFTKNDAPAPDWFVTLTYWLGYGHYAVAIFIVLSGYCLTLPIMRSSELVLRGGVWGFLKRRSRRILPPYFVALICSIALVYIGAHIAPSQSSKLMDHLSLGSILSHVFVVHNLFPDWAKTIDPPMWSVGTEWDIYFVFALLLLPIMRRAGVLVALVAAFSIGLAPLYLLPTGYNLEWACPWYVGLFGLGMLGAYCNFATTGAVALWRAPRFWLICIGVSGAIFLWMLFSYPRVDLAGMIEYSSNWVPDVIIGVIAISFICYCTCAIGRRELDASARTPWVLGFLEAKPLVFIGTWSYSLYLIHQPLIEGIYQVTRALQMTRINAFLLFFIVVLPVVCACAYVFHLVAERPFMNAPAPRVGVKKPETLQEL